MSTFFDADKQPAEPPDGEGQRLSPAVPQGPTATPRPEGVGSTRSEGDRVVRAAGVIGGATLLSRLLGAVRDIVMASFFGTGWISDAFIAAFRVPNLLRRLFGEGSLSIAFVPVFSETLLRQGRNEANRLASSALRAAALILILVTLAGMALAPWLVRVIAPGFSDFAGKFSLTVDLTRIMLPYLFFIGLVALCMGILNVLGHFAAPALAPVFLNLAMIGSITLGSLWTGNQSALCVWLAVGVSAGGALQLALQLPFLLRHGIRLPPAGPLWHPAFHRMLGMLGPVLFGTAVYQINVLVLTLLASWLPQGSISYLYYADRLVQFPLGIFGVATATAALPTFARQSAAGRYDALRQTFAQAMRLVLFITLPCMAGLIVLREPIVALLFQRGAFGPDSTRLTASALLYYCMGLWAFAAVRIVLNLFYALQDTRTPVRMAVFSMAANVLLGLTLMGPMQHDGLALALSLASVLNLGLLAWALRRRLGALGWRGICASALKSGMCAVLMGAVVRAMAGWILPTGGGVKALLPGTAVCGLSGVLLFALSARLARVEELDTVLNIVRKKKPRR